MDLGNYIFGAGVAVLIAYFFRRLYWLSLTNRHNLVTGEPDEAKKDFEKSHDLISWVMLGLSALLVFGSAFV